MEIKLFSSSNRDQLEKQVNKFITELEARENPIVDEVEVTFQMVGVRYTTGTSVVYGAMVHYR